MSEIKKPEKKKLTGMMTSAEANRCGYNDAVADFEPYLAQKDAEIERLRERIKILESGCEKVMNIPTQTALECCAYQGADIPKKWIREVAPAITARAEAIRECQKIIKQALDNK